MNNLEFTINKCSIEQIQKHLNAVDKKFVPPLSSYVDIKDYSKKIYNNATRFEIQREELLVGLIAAYFNDDSTSFITNFSVDLELTEKGTAQTLFTYFEKYCLDSKCQTILLEVFKINSRAIKFYTKNKFIIKAEKEHQLVLEKKYE